MPRSVRSTSSAVLLVLACLLVPLGALSTWSKYEIGDEDSYVATMAPLSSDPAVRAAVGNAVTDAVMSEIDVGPLQGTVKAFVRDAAGSFTETAAYKTAWNAANRAAHDAVERALADDSDGEVSIDLAPITQRIKKQLSDDSVPFASRIPVRHTEVTILNSKDLGPLREGFHMLQTAGLWLPVAAVVLAVAGILLSLRRRRAVIATSLGAALAAAALATAVTVTRSLTLRDLPADLSRDAAGAVYDALTESLWVASWIIMALGLATALTAWLTSRLTRRD
ncbi:Integral membrane protein OS=Streptomyces alboniger OX=132473 GN=CP975_18245 PE=4 SV=1 [Streptomyces alboniger]